MTLYAISDRDKYLKVCVFCKSTKHFTVKQRFDLTQRVLSNIVGPIVFINILKENILGSVVVFYSAKVFCYVIINFF